MVKEEPVLPRGLGASAMDDILMIPYYSQVRATVMDPAEAIFRWR
jgi:hypothetical protein